VTLSSGTRLAQYEVLEPLGSGGMGEVYRARDSRLERDVAIKVLPEHLAADPEMRVRFEREMRAVAALTHPGIMAVFELAKVGDLSFAVVELLEGETLRKRLASGPLKWREAAAIGADVADALAAAHAKGIIHRDVKPENIVLTRDGRTKLLDFGLARSHADASDTHPTIGALTTPGLLMGTVGYIAPEQIRGETASAASDIFATGCVLYEMVTGRMPFARATVAEVLASVLHADPTPLGESGAHVPADLERVIAHCLAKSPLSRFKSARDLALALRGMTAEGSSGSISAAVPTTKARKPQSKAVAVLPFENLTGDADADYLCDGLTESVINSLSQLPKLRVVPRSTVFRYKGRLDDLASVAMALNVRSLVTGRVARRAGNLNIQAELVDVVNDSQLWGDQYLRDGSDVASLQQEIAFQISEGLRLRLTPEEKKRLKRTSTENNEAYQQYLRGRYHWNRWSPEDWKRAIECFERAIQIDSKYALAWSGLGDAYGTLGFYGAIPTRVAMEKAKVAALRALELDASLPEAHVTMSFVRLMQDWDWPVAERELTEAIRLNPRHAAAYCFYGLFSVAAGETEEGIKRALRGRDLDPLSTILNLEVAWAYLFARRFDEAVIAARQTLELDANFAQAQATLCAALQFADRLEEAAAHLAQHGFFWGAPLPGAEALPAVLASSGPDAYYRKQLELMQAAGGDATYPRFPMAIAHAWAGNIDEALTRLEAVVNDHEGPAVFSFVEPGFDPLRAEPRFKALLARLGGVRSAKVQHDQQGARL